MNDKYNSFLIAALLHDIGKFYQRGNNIKKTHSMYSGLFVENYKEYFNDAKLIKELVTHHHEGYYTNDDENPRFIQDDKTRMLAFLLSHADNLSSSEHSKEKSDTVFDTNVPLDCIFSQIKLNNNDNCDKYSYSLSELYEEKSDIFPITGINSNNNKYEIHVDYFTKSFEETFSNEIKVNTDSLFSIIQNFLWCVPSDTTHKPHDVSLSDHLKTTCAIAACAFKYHEENGWNEDDVVNDKINKWKLIAGDISGIQKYIYQIASGKGVSKRLRGRSFKISFITEAIAFSILTALGLPLMCKLISAGGVFYLLVPNTKKTDEIISDTIKMISDYLINTFMGELSFSLADEVIGQTDFHVDGFNKALDRVKNKLAEKKLQKFYNIFNAGAKVFNVSYKGHGVCPVCNRHPAFEYDSNQDAYICEYCVIDKKIGERLVKPQNKWLVISNTLKDCDFTLWNNYYVHIVDEEGVKRLKPIIAYNLLDEKLIAGVNCSYLPYAGYTPRNSSGDVMDFDGIASVYGKYELLGVMRADLDNLGLIFSQGFCSDLSDKISISRMTTLSNMFSVFFSKIIAEEVRHNWQNIYIGYCGGDDMMIVGYYDDIIRFSYLIRDKLCQYTGNNPSITISAGIGTYKPKVPIAITSKQTEMILDCSKKNEGKDSLTVFDNTIKWKDYDCNYKTKQFFLESLNNQDDDFSVSFLYRLLEYYSMYKNRDKDTRNMLYKPRLAYDMSRNLKDKTNPTYSILEGLLSGSMSWKNIIIPISWAAYDNRGKGDK